MSDVEDRKDSGFRGCFEIAAAHPEEEVVGAGGRIAERNMIPTERDFVAKSVDPAERAPRTEYDPEAEHDPEVEQGPQLDQDLQAELIFSPFEEDSLVRPAGLKLVSVRFYPDVAVELCEPGPFDVRIGDEVLVDCGDGTEKLGVVAKSPYYMTSEQVESVFGDQAVPFITRWAEDEDIIDLAAREREALDALATARIKAAEHQLDMKLISARFKPEESKLIFEFISDGRVDFRSLVRELASIFRLRIELRQVGVRDQAAKAGGIGPCGREFCCSTFLCRFRPVSIRMAKDQDLSMNPNNISGCCGRLLCCLRYEHEAYVQARKIMPRVGHTVTTVYGKGRILSTNLLKNELKIELFDADPGDDPLTIHLADLAGRDAVAGVSKPDNFRDPEIVRSRSRGNRRGARREDEEEVPGYDFGDMGGASKEDIAVREASGGKTGGKTGGVASRRRARRGSEAGDDEQGARRRSGGRRRPQRRRSGERRGVEGRRSYGRPEAERTAPGEERSGRRPSSRRRSRRRTSEREGSARSGS